MKIIKYESNLTHNEFTFSLLWIMIICSQNISICPLHIHSLTKLANHHFLHELSAVPSDGSVSYQLWIHILSKVGHWLKFLYTTDNFGN